MTRDGIRALLKSWVWEFAIDPHDAGELFAEVPAEGIDVETFGDWLEGAGYPNLAQDVTA